MARFFWRACAAVLCLWPVWALAYVEAPYTLGRVVEESTHIVLVEVARINADKKLIIFKKIEDLKGEYPDEEIKHNIGERGFHEREWRTIMNWAEVGKRAVFFANADASETCIGRYWYQCYREEAWWGLQHGEPYLLRTFTGEVETLADAVRAILKQEEVVVPALVNRNRDQLHLAQGRIQFLKASLQRQEYDLQRDFVEYADGGPPEPAETTNGNVVIAASSDGWKFLPYARVKHAGPRWLRLNFDDTNWPAGKAPLGYGEEELNARHGTTVGEEGRPFAFRRVFEVPRELLQQPGALGRVKVASDNSAVIFLNGEVVDEDPEEDHEFSYWNREFEVPLERFRAGRNVFAAIVRNTQGSSDLYFDLEFTIETPIEQ